MERQHHLLKSFLPIPAAQILGREKEVQELIHLLEQYSVVTITGTGGIGKTRIAIEICHRINTEPLDDLIFVSMATLTDAREVMPTLANVLGITESANRPLAVGVAEVLFNKQLLLVLDNLEQVTSAAKEISKLVTICPGVKVLCTSRTPLKIKAEQEYSLQTLLVPALLEFESLLDYPAIELFISRAKQVNMNFELTPENSNTIVEICQYLDGLPLALELAASRLRVLTPEQLLNRLDKALNILSSSSKDLPLRHQTLRNTINWSHEFLNESERKLFRRLAVFSKGFNLEAIEEVCYGNEKAAISSIDEIESLVDNALVQKLDTNGRFTLLQTIKDFASEKLIAADEMDSISMKHAQFFHGVSDLIYEGTQGKRQQERMKFGILDEANILNALDYLLEQARQNNELARELGFRICGNLWLFWHILGKHNTTKEYINSFFEASENDTPSLGKCGALFSLHVACYTLGEIEQSEKTGARLLKMAKALNNEQELVKGYLGIGFGNMFSDLEKSIQYNNMAVQLCRKLDETYWLGLSLWQCGIFNLISDNRARAKASYSEALDIFQSLKENEGIGIAQSGLCTLEFMEGNYDQALALYSDTLLAFKAIGDRPEQARILSEMSWTYLAKDDTKTALAYALDSIKAHQEIGSNRGIGISMNALAAIEAVKDCSKRAIEIAAAAQYFADQKGVAIELGLYNHSEVYLENAKKKLSILEIEQAEKAGIRYSLKDILEMVEHNSTVSDKVEYKPYEDAFIKKLKDTIEENLGDSTFGTSQLYHAVSMSQMQVYRKLKTLTNQTPSQFIRSHRLQKGKELLRTSDKTIAEIAYEVGFMDPNYFSRVFMKEFTQTPTEYRR